MASGRVPIFCDPSVPLTAVTTAGDLVDLLYVSIDDQIRIHPARWDLFVSTVRAAGVHVEIEP
jgi:hypothetical protein